MVDSYNIIEINLCSQTDYQYLLLQTHFVSVEILDILLIHTIKRRKQVEEKYII